MTVASLSERTERGGTTAPAAPRLLVVSPVAPVPEGVGGVYLRDLCLMYPADRLSFAILPGIGGAPWPEELRQAPRTMLGTVPERGFNRLGRQVQQSTRALFDRYVDMKHLPRLLDEIASFAEETRPDLVWVPLAGPTMINIAGALPERLGIPMITTVWDPPDYALSHYWGIRGHALDRVMTRFGVAIRRATRCAVASTEMAEAYDERYGTRCVPMIHGLSASQWIKPTGMRSPNGPFVIGYAGSLYARNEWDALIAALGSVQWTVGGRETIVRVLASNVDVRVTGPARIEFLGWHSTADAVKILSASDVCYVPYWFDEAFKSGVELSFPNKVSLYLAAGRPILYHGPERATPTRFLERWPVGVACHSLETNAITDALTRAATDREFHTRAADMIPRVLQEELGLHVFRRRFAEFLGVEDSVLAPPRA